MAETLLDSGDIIVIAVYFVLVLAVGLWVSFVDTPARLYRIYCVVSCSTGVSVVCLTY